MASYRPFPPPPPPTQSAAFPPPPPPPPSNQNPLQQPAAPPPPPPQQQQQQQQQQQRPGQFGPNYGQMGGGPPPMTPSFPPQMGPTGPQNYPPQQQHYPPRPPPHHPHPHQHFHQQYPFQPPPPPPPDSSFQPPPPPPAPQQQQQQPPFYPPSQYPQYGGHQPLQPPMQPPPPPPPPSSPPPSSSMPPPPPPPSSPPPPPPKESGMERDNKGMPQPKERHSNHVALDKQQRLPSLPKKGSGLPGARVETEEERRLRKKREIEKQRQEEKRRQQLKESQNSVLQKPHMQSSHKGHGSMAGSRMGDMRANPLLGGERIENRLKKPTTFLCKMKFRNELPDPSGQPKLMKLKRDEDRFTRYTITSLEKMYKPQLYTEPDLGIPLDLLDLSVYKRPAVRPPLDPEDEELLRDDDIVTPVKKDNIRRKERPTDKGVSWLVKTEYISSVSMDSAKQSRSAKQAKELREAKGGRDLLENLNDRESQIKEIEESFKAAKLQPVHATNKNLRPIEILPFLPDFDREDDKFLVAQFDSGPTADSETYGKMDQSLRDSFESRSVMKACKATGSDPANPDKFLAYMVPAPNELSKDMYDENEDVSYNWVREYQWSVQGDDANDPTSFVVSFDDDAARFVPVPTKLTLKKRKAIEGRSSDAVEPFPAPSKVTVRRRSTAATIELKDSVVNEKLKSKASSSRMGRSDDDDGFQRSHMDAGDGYIDHSEDDMSE